MTWHAGNMEGAHIVVDIGDMAVWLLCLLCRQLLWFMGSWGCWWWWGLLVGEVVIGHVVVVEEMVVG